MSDIRYFYGLRGIELLDESRKNRVYRYRRAEDQARCLTAGLMLRSVFGKKTVESITSSQLGKPYLPDGPGFNLSHSGNKVVLLVGEQAVGVDVEYMTPFSWTVAKKVFTAAEQTWLRQHAQDDSFFRLWTGKEAIMKALGLGFQLPPESFEIHPDAGVPNTVGGREWYLHWSESENHMICTATEHSHAPDGPILLNQCELLQI